MTTTSVSSLGALVVEAVTGRSDRAEVGAVLAAEEHRSRVERDGTALALPPPADGPLDRSHFAEVLEGDRDTVGRWSEVSAVALPWGRVLYRLARTLGGPVVEAGTGSGLSAAYLALGLAAARTDPAAPDARRVVTIEVAPALVRRAHAALAAGGMDVAVVEGDQHDELEPRLRELRPPLVHLDSDHEHASTTALLETVAATVDRPTVVALDDIRWSAGMEQVWSDAEAGAFATVAAFDLELWGILVIDAHEPCPVDRRVLPVPRGLAAARVHDPSTPR